MLNETWARQFAHDWIAAWNRRDLEAILTHYEDEIVFSSPFIARFGADPSGVLRGRDRLRHYWQAALSALPDLHFELQQVLLGADSITLLYQGHRGLVAETLHFAAGSHRACRASACYTLSEGD